MEITRIDFVAFGSFTNKSLIFDQGNPGLHIIYGSNEAGKSTALRGLNALLFGFHPKTPDNFKHDYNQLRIDGYLRLSSGESLEFARYKRMKKTLQTIDGELLEDKVLLPYLQGVSQELFENLFGIDHHALVQGGKDILEQKGDTGQALFSASIGSQSIHAVIERLESEASALFLSSGQKPVINSSIKEFKELKADIKELSLSAKKWGEHHEILIHTKSELSHIKNKINDKQSELNRLKRIQRLLPKLARRRELLQDIEVLNGVEILADDFKERHHDAKRKLETAQGNAEHTQSRLNDLEEKISLFSFSRELLEHKENIEDLHQRLGAYRKDMQKKPMLEIEAQQLLTDAQSFLREIRPDLILDNIDELRPMYVRRLAITKLGSEKAILVASLEEKGISKRKKEARLKYARKELEQCSDIGSTEGLKRAIIAARKLGNIDALIEAKESSIVTISEQCADGLSRLLLWSGKLVDLSELPVPNSESINRFKDEYEDFNSRFKEIHTQHKKTEEALRSADQRLDQIQRVEAVPSEMDLAEARSGRDQVWKLLRRQWVDGDDISADASDLNTEGELPDVFERRIVGTDELSDQLLREADRVHEISSLQIKKESLLKEIEEYEQQLAKCEVEKQTIDGDWRALWTPCDIEPLSPREMQEWLTNLVQLRDQVIQLNTDKQTFSENNQAQKNQIKLLNKQLIDLGEQSSKSELLEVVLLECDDIVNRLEVIKQQRYKLDNEVKSLEDDVTALIDEHQAAEEKLEIWKSSWHELISGYGLPNDSSPAEVVAFMDKLGELLINLDKAEKLRLRIDAYVEEALSFDEQVTKVAASVSPELKGLPADEVATRLNAMLSDNLSKQSNHQQISEQLEQAKSEIREAEVTIKSMTERLGILCSEAKCKKHNELEKAERNSQEYLDVKQNIEELEQEILESGEGAKIDELEMEATDVDSDMLTARLSELDSLIKDELDSKRIDLVKTEEREKNVLAGMDGSDKAAALAEQGQSILAGIRFSAEQYVRLKLAAKILRDEIERYRQENQGPMVKRASECFALLTCGSFVGLSVNLNEKGDPVLVGIRKDESQINVEGMSSGTLDQLFLALRIASLEKYIENSEPMPFIVDDILVDFDDERSEAALNALAQLAKKTQVILFTHHSRVVEQAKKIKTSHIHKL